MLRRTEWLFTLYEDEAVTTITRKKIQHDPFPSTILQNTYDWNEKGIYDGMLQKGNLTLFLYNKISKSWISNQGIDVEIHREK
jgi:hypothetical protein